MGEQRLSYLLRLAAVPLISPLKAHDLSAMETGLKDFAGDVRVQIGRLHVRACISRCCSTASVGSLMPTGSDAAHQPMSILRYIFPQATIIRGYIHLQKLDLEMEYLC